MKRFFLLLIISTPLFAGLDPYHGYPELEKELQGLVANYPEYAMLSKAGESIEKRSLYILSLGIRKNNPGVLLVGGMHARERIASELPLMIAQKLLSDLKAGDVRVKKIFETTTIHIMPMMNPDGVEYDRAGTYRKSWRKNRRDNGDGGFGVDLNRNFGFGWSNDGASDSTFSDIYKGKSPFSEPETQGVRDFVLAHPEIKVAQNYHSYGEQIFYPWGMAYSPIKESADLKRHREMAETMAKMTGYTPMQTSSTALVTGDLCDWAYGTRKIICFGIELDPKDYNDIGHYLPFKDAEMVLKKNWESTLYLLESAHQI